MDAVSNNDTNQRVAGVAVSDPSKLVPKLVTNINFRTTKEGALALSLISETPQGELPVLVETVYLEKEHAHKVMEALKKILANHD